MTEKSKILAPILDEAYCLEYGEMPNYGKIRFQLESLLL